MHGPHSRPFLLPWLYYWQICCLQLDSSMGSSSGSSWMRTFSSNAPNCHIFGSFHHPSIFDFWHLRILKSFSADIDSDYGSAVFVVIFVYSSQYPEVHLSSCFSLFFALPVPSLMTQDPAAVREVPKLSFQFSTYLLGQNIIFECLTPFDFWYTGVSWPYLI